MLSDLQDMFTFQVSYYNIYYNYNLQALNFKTSHHHVAPIGPMSKKV